MTELIPQSSHFGAFEVEVDGRGAFVSARPHPLDRDPSPLIGNVAAALDPSARLLRPLVRRGWLERGPGPDAARGSDAFVEVSWEEALERTAAELRRVIAAHSAAAVYGGSYGWASAGRFHHAQSQLHRFLNCLGGYTRHVNDYSCGASMVLLPHVVGGTTRWLTSWDVIARHTELLVAFGGLPMKNAAVAPGGVSNHRVRDQVRAFARSGGRTVVFSPNRGDVPDVPGSSRHSLVPGSDTAVLLAMCHTLLREGLHDRAFLDRYCTGFPRVRAYLAGEVDGVPKSAEWAEHISGVDRATIAGVAREMARTRSIVTVSYSLQRAEHGEQPVWAALTLACMLGQIGLPGGGFGHGYGSIGDIGLADLTHPLPVLTQGSNPVRDFIPVARIADMLLAPGTEYEYNGERRRYPHVRLVYWAGGNPFHHHQDLGRLQRAFTRPETVIVHESFWTSTAKHADIVLPTTTTLERNDIGASRSDPCLVAMRRVVEPMGQARSDFEILGALASRLDVAEAFTQGRDEAAWLRHLYGEWADAMKRSHGFRAPAFEAFWSRGYVELPPPRPQVFLADFRADPAQRPLATPSGRIELFSERIASFGYPDCPGHAAWLEPEEWPGSDRARRYPLVLLANQPRSRLHSQLDHGAVSRASKVRGREALRIHPRDAAARGIADGDVVRVFNDRGSCLAGAEVGDAVDPGVLQMSTGAPFTPIDPGAERPCCAAGNVNVLTADRGSSRLAQGSIGARVLVEVEPLAEGEGIVQGFRHEVVSPDR